MRVFRVADGADPVEGEAERVERVGRHGGFLSPCALIAGIAKNVWGTKTGRPLSETSPTVENHCEKSARPNTAMPY